MQTLKYEKIFITNFPSKTRNDTPLIIDLLEKLIDIPI